MADEMTVVVDLTRSPGRFIAETRDLFLVTDATAGRGGEERSWMAGELLLAALGTCAVSSVSAFAAEEGASLEDVQATTTSVRHPDDPTRYESILLSVITRGVDQATADHLVQRFTENCPVYGTVSRGGNISWVATAEPASAELAATAGISA
jgi:uncharacterized OsmC-like protein